MSVVNKMLQDLEARQSQAVEITADYQPPPQKQSKLLVLLLLTFAIGAIIFALIDKDLLLGENKNTEIKTAENNTLLPVTARKMTVVAKPKQIKQAQLPTTSTLSKGVDEKLTGATVDNKLDHNALTDEPIEQSEHNIGTDESPSLDISETQKFQIAEASEGSSAPPNEQVKTKGSTELAGQTTAEQASSFSMSNTSQENSTSSLKQRIAESLTNEDLDMAESLLQQLLVTEPNNIKTRKKLASLLFAKGNNAQTKQLLIQGIELHPAQGDLKLMLARLYVVLKQPSQAMSTLAEFQPNTEIQNEYLAYRAALAQKLKQTKLAKADYQTLTTIEPANAKWWLGLAIAQDQLGETNMAVRAYNKASSLEQLNNSVNEFIQQRITILAGAQ